MSRPDSGVVMFLHSRLGMRIDATVGAHVCLCVCVCMCVCVVTISVVPLVDALCISNRSC